MLQQTQVSTVIPYFKRFVQKIPNFKKLSKANDQTLMKLWEGLGYYSRARNLKKSAIMINGKFGGILPSNFEDLKSLPIGVGDYTSCNNGYCFSIKNLFLWMEMLKEFLKEFYTLEMKKIYQKKICKFQKFFGLSERASDYAKLSWN